jgi:hypothetical protein
MDQLLQLVAQFYAARINGISGSYHVHRDQLVQESIADAEAVLKGVHEKFGVRNPEYRHLLAQLDT